MGDGTTIGIHVPEGSEFVDEFDEVMEGTLPASGAGAYSRSRAAKNAMHLSMDVVREMEALDLTARSPPELRALVREALRTYAREEERREAPRNARD